MSKGFYRFEFSAISNSKNNKSPGIDGINNELLKNGGDCLTNSLFKLFNKILETNVTPKEWNTGVIIPIHKKGDHNDLNNYRGITLTPCISKIFNRIIANEISEFLEKGNILTEVQGGFRKDHRCEDHISTLKSIAASRLTEGKPTYMAFLDFSKAFDTVWRDGLMYSVWNIGIRGMVWQLIDNLYKNVQAMVKFGNVYQLISLRSTKVSNKVACSHQFYSASIFTNLLNYLMIIN